MSEPLAAVVLAGGASRRMGRDKATMPHPSRPAITMVENTVAVVATRCEPVFVVAAPGQVLPIMAATARGLRAAAETGRDRAFVAAVDMPELAGEVIDVVAGHPDVDVVLAWDGRDHYLAAVYRTALADRIDDLVAAGARSMRALTDTVVTYRVEVPRPSWLTNLNRPGDLR